MSLVTNNVHPAPYAVVSAPKGVNVSVAIATDAGLLTLNGVRVAWRKANGRFTIRHSEGTTKNLSAITPTFFFANSHLMAPEPITLDDIVAILQAHGENA